MTSADTAVTTAASRRGSSWGDRVRMVIRGFGQLFITVGVVLLLFVAYELWFTGVYTEAQQHKLLHALQGDWSTPGWNFQDVALGQGVAVIRIPRLGQGYAKVVVEGVGTADLKKGPGHYPGTAMPGQIGNFVVSGHRTTYGAPFNRLDEVKPGDHIIVETKDTWFIYQEIREQVVAPDDISVIAPVPEHPGEKPSQAMLTFTTCNPKYSARQRLILFGDLIGSRPKSQGPPPELTSGHQNSFEQKG